MYIAEIVADFGDLGREKLGSVTSEDKEQLMLKLSMVVPPIVEFQGLTMISEIVMGPTIGMRALHRFFAVRILDQYGTPYNPQEHFGEFLHHVLAVD